MPSLCGQPGQRVGVIGGWSERMARCQFGTSSTWRPGSAGDAVGLIADAAGDRLVGRVDRAGRLVDEAAAVLVDQDAEGKMKTAGSATPERGSTGSA